MRLAGFISMIAASQTLYICFSSVFCYFPSQETTASGAVVFQSPRVKSGNSTGMPPCAME